MSFIEVRHNIEVAHRLYDMKGKCEAIHGHSMWVELKLHGIVDSMGTLDGLEFGEVKRLFRGHLDETYDHHLLLNEADPWSKPLYLGGVGVEDIHKEDLQLLPGLRTFSGDPTTENIARWIAKWAHMVFGKSVDVTVHETAVNAAGFTIR